VFFLDLEDVDHQLAGGGVVVADPADDLGIDLEQEEARTGKQERPANCYCVMTSMQLQIPGPTVPPGNPPVPPDPDQPLPISEPPSPVPIPRPEDPKPVKEPPVVH